MGKNSDNIFIEPASLSDIPWIVEELRSFSKVYGTKTHLFPKDESHLTRLLTNMAENHYMVVASNQSAQRTGFICGHAIPHVLNPDIRILVELFWWVTPVFRGTGVGKRLLQEFTKWGRLNADWIQFGHLTTTQVKNETLTELGYELKQVDYLLEA